MVQIHLKVWLCIIKKQPFAAIPHIHNARTARDSRTDDDRNSSSLYNVWWHTEACCGSRSSADDLSMVWEIKLNLVK